MCRRHYAGMANRPAGADRDAARYLAWQQADHHRRQPDGDRRWWQWCHILSSGRRRAAVYDPGGGRRYRDRATQAVAGGAAGWPGAAVGRWALSQALDKTIV